MKTKNRFIKIAGAKTKDLIYIAETIADKEYDGHLTMLRFTGGKHTGSWKTMFGTPDLDIDGRAKVIKLKDYPTLAESLEATILNHCKKQ